MPHPELRRFHEVSRALLRAAGRGGPRAALLEALSDLLLDYTHASALRLRFEEGAHRHEWRSGVLTAAPRGLTAPVAVEGGRAFPFEIDAEDRGALILEGLEGASEARLEIYAGLAPLLGAALAHHRAQAALRERVKELTCMYRLTQIGAEEGLGLDEALEAIVALLPAAWQHPERARARIILDDRAFTSPGFEEGDAAQEAPISIQGARRGCVTLFYVDPPEGEAPFLEDERHLIEGVARELAFIIERREAALERARLHEQIRHADRLATIGQLAAGVAHELNEPLGNILGFAQLAAKAPQLPAQVAQDLDHIVTASLYAREIIKKLMFFSRQAPARRAAVALETVIHDSLALLTTRCARAGVQVEREIDADLPEIMGDAAQIQQVFVNLLVNATQAMPEGGILRVGAAREGDQLRAWVADTGAGIAPEALKKIFLPFFTTKEVGQGTGLGLSVVHGIITGHGGRVSVESAPGEGARFEIRLPLEEG